MTNTNIKTWCLAAALIAAAPAVAIAAPSESSAVASAAQTAAACTGCYKTVFPPGAIIICAPSMVCYLSCLA